VSMSKVYIPSSGPDDWQQFLAEPEKQWRRGGSSHSRFPLLRSGLRKSRRRPISSIKSRSRAPRTLGQASPQAGQSAATMHHRRLQGIVSVKDPNEALPNPGRPPCVNGSSRWTIRDC